MNRIITLIIFILFSLNGLCQQKDTSMTSVPNKVGKEIIKELTRKDLLENELKITQENKDILIQNLNLRDSIIQNQQNLIKNYQQKENNYNNIVNLKDEQLNSYKNNIFGLNKNLKKQKTINKISLGALIILGSLYIIKK